jgi:ribosomal protein S18 acetylase RimI-like enzyme
MNYTINAVALDSAPWGQIHGLLDACYNKHPRNVFDLVASASHRRQLLWLAEMDGQIVGMIMLSPHSKGGHLENLAVDSLARGRGIARCLVDELLHFVGQRGPAVVSLTTRIPDFFEPLGFKVCGKLDDGSIPMVSLLPGAPVLIG